MSFKEREHDGSNGRDLAHTRFAQAAPIGGSTPIADRVTHGYLGGPTSSETVAIKVLTRAHTITATVEIPPEGVAGVIVSHGDATGGYTMFVQDGYLHYVHNYCGALELHVVSLDPVPSGRVRLRVEFEPAKTGAVRGEGMPGRTQLYFDDRMVADKIFPVTVPLSVGSSSGLSIGKNPGSAVTRLYAAPFAFTGKIVSVRYDLSDRLVREAEELRQALRFARTLEH
jgi:arylsulfatase